MSGCKKKWPCFSTHRLNDKRRPQTEGERRVPDPQLESLLHLYLDLAAGEVAAVEDVAEDRDRRDGVDPKIGRFTD